MKTSHSDFAIQLNDYLPTLNKIEHYCFVTRTTKFEKANKDCENEVKRNVAIIYLGIKEGFRVYQIITTKINLMANGTFLDTVFLKKIAFLFDYIEAGVNDKGFIKKIFNINDLKLRMQQIKNDLETDNLGKAFIQVFDKMAELLQDEKKAIRLLESYRMFGLYFNGLNQRFQKTAYNPIIRTKKLNDFGHIDIQKEITIEEKEHNYTFTLNKKSEAEIEEYKGCYKTKFNHLLWGTVVVKNEKTKIEYSVSWEG